MISPAVTQPVQLPENSSRRGSALSPLSTTPFPADDPTPPVNPGQRLARRTFDPARGVELFKQVTEETLYRFLKNSNPWNGEDLAVGPFYYFILLPPSNFKLCSLGILLVLR